MLISITLYLAVKVVNQIIPLSIVPVKHPEIDGLRGYLALFVFNNSLSSDLF